VRQDFGYSPTHFAGQAVGESGSVIQRAAKLAFYAAVRSPAKTLDDKLTASGSFSATASDRAPCASR
jgi:hypothetical protein